MAIDTAEKRKSVAGLFRIHGPGVTPNASPDAEWRLEAGYSYSGIAAFTPDTDFSDVRVEANAPQSATLRWTYSGAATSIQIWRSTDNVTFTVIATVDPADGEYIDDTPPLETKTLYYYKLSDDLGVTFSATVRVQTYVGVRSLINQTPQRVIRLGMPEFPHPDPIEYASGVQYDAGVRTPKPVVGGRSGGSGGGASANIRGLPFNAGTTITPKQYNDLADQTESRIHDAADSSEPCTVCILNGAIVIDCSHQCKYFRVVMTEDINSISILGCDPWVCPVVEFIVPPNTTRGACGWPIGCEFLGDECFTAPIEGGPEGTTQRSDGTSFPGTGQPLGPGGSSGPCPCGIDQTYRMICCSGGDCILNCSTNPIITLKACGGVAPYTWTKSGGVNIDPSGSICRVSVQGDSGTSTDVTSAAFGQLGVQLPQSCFGSPPACSTSGACGGNLRTADLLGVQIQRTFNCRGQELDRNNFSFPDPYTAFSISMHCEGQNCLGVSQNQDITASIPGTTNISSCWGAVAMAPFPACLPATDVLTTPFGDITGVSVPCVGGANAEEFWQDQMFDFRTPAMIAAGCTGQPCQGKLDARPTVTVTDGTGASITRVVGGV